MLRIVWCVEQRETAETAGPAFIGQERLIAWLRTTQRRDTDAETRAYIERAGAERRGEDAMLYVRQCTLLRVYRLRYRSNCRQ